jgi:hypothetical protein
MISVKDVRLILFHWVKTNPQAISLNTGITGEMAFNSSMLQKPMVGL